MFFLALQLCSFRSVLLVLMLLPGTRSGNLCGNYLNEFQWYSLINLNFRPGQMSQFGWMWHNMARAGGEGKCTFEHASTARGYRAGSLLRKLISERTTNEIYIREGWDIFEGDGMLALCENTALTDAEFIKMIKYGRICLGCLSRNRRKSFSGEVSLWSEKNSVLDRPPTVATCYTWRHAELQKLTSARTVLRQYFIK